MDTDQERAEREATERWIDGYMARYTIEKRAREIPEREVLRLRAEADSRRAEVARLREELAVERAQRGGG